MGGVAEYSGRLGVQSFLKGDGTITGDFGKVLDGKVSR